MNVGWTRLLATGLLFAAVAGCGTSNVVDGTPTSQPATEGPSVPPRSAPALDLTRQKADPCSILSPQDLAGIPVAFPGESSQAELPGPSCDYTQLQPGGPFLSIFVNTSSGGLQGLYELRQRFGVFDAGTVSGYPTVNAIPAPDPRVCSLNAGVNDAELLTVDIDVGFDPPPDLGDRCDVAARLLAAAIAKIGNS